MSEIEEVGDKEIFAHIVCSSCGHKNYFIRLVQCPNCGSYYEDEARESEND